MFSRCLFKCSEKDALPALVMKMAMVFVQKYIHAALLAVATHWLWRKTNLAPNRHRHLPVIADLICVDLNGTYHT